MYFKGLPQPTKMERTACYLQARELELKNLIFPMSDLIGPMLSSGCRKKKNRFPPGGGVLSSLLDSAKSLLIAVARQGRGAMPGLDPGVFLCLTI